MLANLPLGPYLIPCLLLVTVLVGVISRHKPGKPPDLPWLNHHEGEWFGRTRARFRTVGNFRDSIHSAYTKYSKAAQSCIVPSLADEVILLPAQCIDWLIAQPDSLVSNLDAIKDVLLPHYTLLRPDIVHNPTHHQTIRGPLTRNLAGLVPDIFDEVASAFDDLWGTDTSEWKEICPYESMLRIVARGSNRVFVGKSLCRDPELLDIAVKWAQLMPMSASILRQLPLFSRPFLAPLITFFNHWYARKFIKIVKPEVIRRQQLAQSQKADKPNDLLQWTIDLAESSALVSERDPETIALRLLVINFAAIHTSTFSVTHAIFDLVSSDSSYQLQIREEVHEALAANSGKWDKGVLQRLVKLDSSMRESSRLGSFLSFGLSRKVIAPDGLKAPNGTHCPRGSTIAVPTNGIHNDAGIYDDAAEYKPFRFADLRESAPTPDDQEAESPLEKNTTHLVKNANLSFVSLSPQYHPFGYGRHACPGRFFASNELKLLLAYMFDNYEIESDSARPSRKWVGSTLLPPMVEKVKVRKLDNVAV
ncbi:uncharacterized protein HMPREF1541_01577 [Cyphellophora europaea CBS 101466]|uniref:Cytochrome P450 n=1 Tax=Cyphellophora europaea (strain CBS 101466) TaxID=1220924 RepID=W2S188_CYPE1|nr:uncharacterized protein HMPREF1541_01577 [Cyphellophora europaea CBS 101466]ETN42422.1 hypothetical protein HMPREF1541_01577 [Cyphellophora europaea CBS 101466]